ncbi:glycine betaine/proline transport system ATP-binding protein [Paraburkholderia sp. BL18I3N2]|uniref:quaternary amine ABC transporter ATP-binding protein n=1 Tax=unclassified Paraburkholderia TaxID=2615204 RepID=UPI000D453BE4|nr:MULTISPECIES: betaine/proline/choline family ABC transporter ATP-binding protein [unclassified Paraburkholderia]PRX20180.1 glycine betaine/proline transport system ATP-binding protein [Paraburkholderia sp. BL18I3N2]PRX89958.1 glycine betaine/proline transport system ATP-binding protein [Paraburkholderia sp. BL25I1N1]
MNISSLRNIVRGLESGTAPLKSAVPSAMETTKTAGFAAVAETTALLELRGLYKVFGPHSRQIREALEQARAGISKEQILSATGCNVAVRDVSLSVYPGEIFVIMGLSGSGKSTLVRHFNRLVEPTAGQLLFRGTDVLKLNARQLREMRRFHIGMVFQSFALLPHKTVLENVTFGRWIRGDDAAASREAARAWINGRLGLQGYDDRYPDELSGGMRQRVGLARALVAEPDVLLMDEAFSALDPLIRAEMQDILLEMQADLRRTIVFITHDLDEAMKIGSRIAIMKDGAVIQVGTPEQIRTNPANDYVRRFVDAR